MKPFLHIILCLVFASCTACTSPAPVPPQPPTPPAPVVAGHFTIRSYDVNGNVKKTYADVSAYKERSFPRSVTFDYEGQLVTLNGSYQISKPK